MTDIKSFDDAIVRSQKYLEYDPKNPYLRLRLADLYHRAGRFEEAISSYQDPILLSTDSRLAKSGLASVFISQYRFDEAEVLFRELLVDEPKDPALCHNHGLCLYFQHRWEEAFQAFSRAELYGLKTAGNFSYATKALYQSGHIVSAIQACRKWLNAAQDVESMTYLAGLLDENGESEGARKLAKEILKIDSNNVPANVIMGFKHIEDVDMNAAAHFGFASSQEPENALAWLGMGLAHLQQKDAAKAKVMLEKAVELAPKNVGAIVALGWSHIVSGDAKSAEFVFKQALNVDQSFGEAHGGMASVLAIQGDLNASRREITKARRLNSKGFGAEFAQAVVLAKEGHHDASSDWLSSVLKMPAADGMKPLIDQIHAAGL